MSFHPVTDLLLGAAFLLVLIPRTTVPESSRVQLLAASALHPEAEQLCFLGVFRLPIMSLLLSLQSPHRDPKLLLLSRERFHPILKLAFLPEGRA